MEALLGIEKEAEGMMNGIKWKEDIWFRIRSFEEFNI